MPAGAASPATPSTPAIVTLLPSVLALPLPLALVPAEQEVVAVATAEASEGTRECVALGAAEGAPLADTANKKRNVVRIY